MVCDKKHRLSKLNQNSWLKSVQTRAARLVTKTYSRVDGCVLPILNRLNCPSLQDGRLVVRLGLLYKTVHKEAAIIIPPYVQHVSPHLAIFIHFNLFRYKLHVSTVFGRE